MMPPVHNSEEDHHIDQRQRVFKATANSEFLRHPESGGFFRNPLRQKCGWPTLLSEGEYKHNGLDEALKNFPTIKISETNFRKLMGQETPRPSTTGGIGMLPQLSSPDSQPSTPLTSCPGTASSLSSTLTTPRSTPSSARSMQRKLPLRKLPDATIGCDIVVSIFIGGHHDHHGRHHDHHGHHHGHRHHHDHHGRPSVLDSQKSSMMMLMMQQEAPVDRKTAKKEIPLDNIGIDVILTGVDSSNLQVARIRDGHVARWNRSHPELQVRPGDHIVGVNDLSGCPPTSLANELGAASGNVTFHVRRPEAKPARGAMATAPPKTKPETMRNSSKQ